MRLPCRLRQARGDRTLHEIQKASGIAQPYLSQIERGQLVPKDEWIPGLERAYGVDVTAFYESWAMTGEGTPRIMVTLEPDDEAGG